MLKPLQNISYFLDILIKMVSELPVWVAEVRFFLMTWYTIFLTVYLLLCVYYFYAIVTLYILYFITPLVLQLIFQVK